MRVLAIPLLLTFAVFAGCTDAPTVAPPLTADVPTNLLKDGRDLRTDLKETDVIEGPLWDLGDSFGHHLFFEGGPSGGVHIQTYVVEDDGGSWFLATDDEYMAKIEAVWDIPILGNIKKDDLSSTGFGNPWEPYEFPLQHGKTWTGEVMTGDIFGGSESVPITYEVTYNPAISTPDGNRPGFDITGTTEEGILLAYDFVPDIQWYAHFYNYDLSTDAPEDFTFHVMSMGHEKNWSGEYFVDTAEVAVAIDHGIAADPDNPGAPYVAPGAPTMFTIDEGATYVYGYAYAVAFAGVQEVMIVDPANKQYEFRAVWDDPDDVAEASGELDLPAVAGEWRIAGVGAGAVTVWGVHLWQVTQETKTFGASAAA